MNKKKKKKTDFIQESIKRPGALTKLVGGKPSKNIKKVREISKKGTPLQQKQADFYLEVLAPLAKKRKGK